MTTYRAKYKVVPVNQIMPTEIPSNAFGVTVTPTSDGGPSLVIAWLEPLGEEGADK